MGTPQAQRHCVRLWCRPPRYRMPSAEDADRHATSRGSRQAGGARWQWRPRDQRADGKRALGTVR